MSVCPVDLSRYSQRKHQMPAPITHAKGKTNIIIGGTSAEKSMAPPAEQIT